MWIEPSEPTPSPDEVNQIEALEIDVFGSKESETDVMITVNNVEIRTEADVDKAAKQIPVVRNVKQWHGFCDQIGKSVRVMNEG